MRRLTPVRTEEVVAPGVGGRRVRMWYADGSVAHVEVASRDALSRAKVTFYGPEGEIVLLDWPAVLTPGGDLQFC